MGVGYILVNHSRNEAIRFRHLAATTARELTGNSVAAAIVTWYLLHHPQDRIAFVSDTFGEWPFPSGGHSDLASYPDVTDQVVNELIGTGILEDCGIA